jgi:hypothetical protein
MYAAWICLLDDTKMLDAQAIPHTCDHHLLATDTAHGLLCTYSSFRTCKVNRANIGLQGMNFDAMWSVQHGHSDILCVAVPF